MMLQLGSVISRKCMPKTGTSVEGILSRKVGGSMNIIPDRCINKVIKLGEHNNSKLKILGVDTIEIHPHIADSKRITLKDSCGEIIMSGDTDCGVRKEIAAALKAIKKIKEFNPNLLKSNQ